MTARTPTQDAEDRKGPELSDKPRIAVNVHISIKIENIHEDTHERAQRVADRITAEESARVRDRLQNDLAEEFSVEFVGPRRARVMASSDLFPSGEIPKGWPPGFRSFRVGAWWVWHRHDTSPPQAPTAQWKTQEEARMNAWREAVSPTLTLGKPYALLAPLTDENEETDG